jgi:glycerophosphoryl diester phosphodiesterase
MMQNADQFAEVDMKRLTKTVAVSILLLLILASLSVVAAANAHSHQENVPKAPRLVAHAGGDIHGVRMTNSRQALDKSYEEGFRFIEVDICKTSDDAAVLAHDWGNANWFSGVKYSSKVPTYSEFMSRKAILGLDMLDLASLAQWLDEHEDAYIITDIKQENTEILREIAEKYPKAAKRLIPQVYSFSEYDSVKALGFDNIILTEYRLKAKDQEILDFCSEHSLFALTLSQDRATPEFLNKCRALDIPIYVHTINDYNVYIKLRDNGAYGVYTDFFQPSDWVE